MRSLHTLTPLVLLIVACREEQPFLTTAPADTVGTPSILSVSASGEHSGDGTTITVTANVNRVRGAKVVGSFVGRLRYDPAGLTFVTESKLPSGMRALNPQLGEIRVAGATPEGFEAGHLFAVTFKVVDRKALASIELVLDEMNGIDFMNQLPADPHLRSARLVSAPR